MKHLLTKNQRQRIANETEFDVVENKPFDLYELRYRKSKFKKFIIYLKKDSIADDRPIFRQITDFNTQFNPEENAAKRYLAIPTVHLQEYLDYYLMLKQDLVKLAKVIME